MKIENTTNEFSKRSLVYFYKIVDEYDSLPEDSDYETLNKKWREVEKAACTAIFEIGSLLIRNGLIDDSGNLTKKGKDILK